MLEILGKVRALLVASERRELALLAVMILGMAMIEVVGVASIMPFMAVVANPEVIQSNRWLFMAYTHFEFDSPNRFLIALGVLVFIFLLFSNSFAALTLWYQSRFVERRGFSLGRRLLIRYVSEPYAFFLNRNASELAKNVITEVRKVIGGVLLPFIRVMSGGTVAIAILCLLLVVDAGLALTVAVVLGSLYSVIYMFVRRKLLQAGHTEIEVSGGVFKTVNEALTGIKDIKVLGREKYFVDLYSKYASRGAENSAMAQVISMMPKFSLEVVAFGGILLIILYLLSFRHAIDHVIPLISLYAFAGYRLMPAIQQIFGSLSIIRYHVPALNLVHEDYFRYSPALAKDVMEARADGRIALKERIRLENVSFAYPGAPEEALRGVSLEIKARTTVGFVGKTGCGKTTTIDVLMGLLFPQEGRLRVDEVRIDPENVRIWHREIGYVPQTIFLSDDSILRNIAFGVADGEIDFEAVRRAARQASLADFIEKELKDGYETLVGDRGVRLSGGQRQRIGIARALYHDPEVLVFDEATSSLDNQTEEMVNQAIRGVAGKKTVIVIAHRLSTVRDCDRIFYMEKGVVAASGRFDELNAECEGFRTLAGSQ